MGFTFSQTSRIIRLMKRERVQLSGDELRKVLQAHYRAFVTDVRAIAGPSGVVAVQVEFAQQPLQLEAAKRTQH